MERRLYNHHHGMHPNNHSEEDCIYMATDAEILAAAANLDGAETVSLDGANVGPGVPDDEIELSVYVKREKGVDWFRHNVQVLLIPLPDKETPHE